MTMAETYVVRARARGRTWPTVEAWCNMLLEIDDHSVVHSVEDQGLMLLFSDGSSTMIGRTLAVRGRTK